MSYKNQSPAMKTLADLDAYRSWCVEFGYVFDERNLYNQKSNWSLYQRSRHGDKSIRNNWIRDANYEFHQFRKERDNRQSKYQQNRR
jgi:hypothetical protein